jgi:hypothetical protein
VASTQDAQAARPATDTRVQAIPAAETTTRRRGSRRPPDLDSLRGETPSREVWHEPRVRSCGALSLIGTNGDEAGVYTFRCKRWACPRCGDRLVRRTRQRILAGLVNGNTWLVTLTAPGTEAPEASMEEFGRRWKRLHQRLIRAFGPLEYVAALELQKRGNPHFHILLRSSIDPGTWLRRNAPIVRFGRMVDVRRAVASDARYITKALGPGTDGDRLPAYARRVRWSRGWSTLTTWRPRRAWASWFVAAAGTLRTAASARALGYRVVEVAAGPPDRRSFLAPVRWRPILVAFAR